MERFLGIDVGGTNVKFGVVKTDGELISKVKYPTADLRRNRQFVQHFLEAIDEQLSEHKEINKVGIGVPGTLSHDRTITLEMANLSDLNGVHLYDKLHAAFPHIQFHLENDANAAALGEYYFGSNPLPETYLFITLGTGVGSAAIIDKKIFKGGNGNAMEAGHIIAADGRTVEDNIGKKGIVEMAKQAIESYGDATSMALLADELDAKKVVKAAKKGDQAAQEVFQKVGFVLGECLVSLVRILDAKTILIGGGVAQTFPLIEESIYQALRKHLTPYYLQDMQIQPATLGNEAGIIGAASLCFID